MINPSLTVRIDHPDAGLLRSVTDEEREAYERDGAAVLKGILPIEWVEYMREAVTRLLAHPDPSSQNYAAEGEARFFAQAFPWLLDDAFKAFALYGPLKDIAKQIWPDTTRVNLFYDQVFAKEPGAGTPTPWHQDLPFLPLDGEQILRIWVPLDRVTAESGAVHYLKGSHRWGVVYHPIGFKDIPEITSAYVDSPYTDQPDFEADYDKYEWLIGEVEPGDAVLHHPKTVHGSRGNTTNNFRRAVTVVYTGDRAAWNPHPANMFKNKDLTGHVEMPDLEPGGSIECDLFPRVWPEVTVPAGVA
ncbi:Phytanoyl-CoA dioxygenase [Carbonactinospora thermoautotrophica]|uniref:Phytanoyl-CoA dioxygenase n=1 Tax=Carbonactinospora thermoautotrophica TaxID=1469144 RepID=A0A132MMQ6_9ACTN|nr:phytanoyl-CoA dioxygenase family protein [Carbonactinospora thermoautotrophica]KWW99073.1 Phytanoyl-CoA dioxygenase [Carbonactinospora thermoautotrophica]